MPKRIEGQPLSRSPEYKRMWRENRRKQYNEYFREYHASKKADETYRERRNESGMWSRRKRKYGLDKETYLQLVEHQQGRCAICGVHENEFDRAGLRVDHNHITKEVRGLLCCNCNSGLGLFKENPKYLAAAIKYLVERGQVIGALNT